jgi:hypothetical protein
MKGMDPSTSSLIAIENEAKISWSGTDSLSPTAFFFKSIIC